MAQTTLFVALNILDGSIISRIDPRHRHTEWLDFLRQIDRETGCSISTRYMPQIGHEPG